MRRHDRPRKDLALLLHDAEGQQHTLRADVHVRRDGRRGNVALGPDEDIVAYPDRVEGHLAPADPHRGPERAVGGDYACAV